MTLEFNIDEHNQMLIAFVTGPYEFEKIIKVIRMSLEKSLEKNLKRVLIDMAQVSNPDVSAIKKYTFGNEMFLNWGKKMKMCIVYDHKYIPEINEEAKEGPGKWALITANQNQSVFWLLSS